MAPRETPCNKLADSPLFEMQKSSYLFNEVTSLMIVIISCIMSYFVFNDYGIIITTIVFVALFHSIWFILLIIFMPKLSKPHSNWFKPPHQIPKFIEKLLETSDGTHLKYYISERNKKKKKKNKKIICLANPLGHCGYSIFNPLICHLGTDQYIYISWDYRGFFGSTNNHKKTSNDILKIRDISIHEFARDINEILLSESINCIDYMVGHSMGVQVTLEFVVSYPHKIDSIILLNGSHGTVFSTAFQPVLRIPFIADLIHEFFSFMLNHPYLMEYIRFYFLKPSIKYYFKIYVKIFGSPLLQEISGENYLFEFFEHYLNGICACNQSLYHWFRAFQELHSHSVYHLLDKIQHPTLIISGLFDLLLPALVSFEMARKLPNCRHCCDIYSSHLTILENPESCVYEIVSFIKNTHSGKVKKVHAA